jgi:hypothetical protein
LEFRARHRPPAGSDFWQAENLPSPEEASIWREWMTAVLIPLTRAMKDAVIQHADLVRETGSLPQPLQDLCAHAAGYELLLARWSKTDFVSNALADHVSLIDYPAASLTPYLTDAYIQLKSEQQRLLKTLQPRTRALETTPSTKRQPTMSASSGSSSSSTQGPLPSMDRR